MATRFLKHCVPAACYVQRAIRLVPQSCTTNAFIQQSRNLSTTWSCNLPKAKSSTLPPVDEDMFKSGFADLPALENASADVQKMLKLKFAHKREWNKEKINLIKDELKQHSEDNGSAPVQIGALTVRIEYLKNHMRVHRKDKYSLRTLMQLISHRRKLLVHMRAVDFTYYHELLTRLQIKPIPEHKFKKNKHKKA